MVLEEAITTRLMVILYTAVCLMQPLDRMNFCKLFQELINRKLPPLVVRLLLSMYTKHVTHVSWNGVFSKLFMVSNGVK